MKELDLELPNIFVFSTSWQRIHVHPTSPVLTAFMLKIVGGALIQRKVQDATDYLTGSVSSPLKTIKLFVKHIFKGGKLTLAIQSQKS